MEQIKKVVNSSWFKSIAICIIGIALIAEKHLLYSGVVYLNGTMEANVIYFGNNYSNQDSNWNVQTVLEEALGEYVEFEIAEDNARWGLILPFDVSEVEIQCSCRPGGSCTGDNFFLGLYGAKLKNNSAINKIYNVATIKERHRHRYEVNNSLKNQFEKKGLIFSGMSPDNKLPEIIELKNHPWFIGVQFHPEFKSRPLSPHPLFSSFIKAAKSFNGK